MSKIMFREAIASALAEEMRRDEKVFVMGEDVAITGGVFKATKGIYIGYRHAFVVRLYDEVYLTKLTCTT